MIRPVKISDTPAIRDIYNYYIEHTVITFEETPLSLNEMEARIQKISTAYPYLIREDEGEVSGYAYANLWKERSAYRNSAEISIYLKNETQGQGRGYELLGRLLDDIRTTSLHVLIAGITLPNDHSVNLFEKYGFRKIGQFNEVGFKSGRWLDVGYWELIIN
jgi:phosphinothricin acetyltransferase